MFATSRPGFMDQLGFAKVFDAVPGLYVLLSPELEIVAVTDAYLRATSTKRDDLLARQLTDVFHTNLTTSAANGGASLRSSLDRVRSSGIPDTMPLEPYDFRRPDGTLEERHRRLSNTPVLNGEGKVIAILHGLEEVTGQRVRERERPERTPEPRERGEAAAGLSDEERRVLTEKIARQARVFETTLSSISDFAYIFDKAGRFVYANQALLTLWGLTLDDAVGKDFFDLKYPETLAATLQSQIQHVFETGENVRDETPYTSPTGAGGFYEYIFAPVRGINGEIEVVAGSTRDITERKAAEREREGLIAAQQVLQAQNVQLLEAERVARAEAERVGHVKDEFLATLSHELRTPLNAILGWVQILSRTERDPRAVLDGLGIIERNAQAQKKLIEDLLDMSRIVSGKVRLDVHRIHLGDVVNAVVTALQPTADTKGVHVRTVFDTTAPTLWGDENRLQQVIWNLLSNAIKFTPRGGDVEVGLQRAGSQVQLTVSDTGIGMKPEFVPYAFDRFRQSDASTTRIHGGLGLGLAIVKTLVELHGGRLEARSDGPGRGSTFVVSLPQAAAIPLRKDAAKQTLADEGDSSSGLGECDPRLLEGVRVLVVDDELDGRTLVGRILEECSAEVALAASAREALTLAAEFEPDVLVSDIGMPEIDGYELMRHVRSLEGKKGCVPAAALTALARPEDRTRALMSGYQTHIVKPVDARELIAAVAALAGRTGLPLVRTQTR